MANVSANVQVLLCTVPVKY